MNSKETFLLLTKSSKQAKMNTPTTARSIINIKVEDRKHYKTFGLASSSHAPATST
jgi:hypothetical protein